MPSGSLIDTGIHLLTTLGYTGYILMAPQRVAAHSKTQSQGYITVLDTARSAHVRRSGKLTFLSLSLAKALGEVVSVR